MLFVSGIANNAGSWVKVVSELIIRIIQRLEVSSRLYTLIIRDNYNLPFYITQTLKLNEEASRDLDNDVKAFLYIVARNGGRNPNDQIVEQFKECAFIEPRLILTDSNNFYYRRIQSILAEVSAAQPPFLRSLNVEETRDMITRIRQNLDSAVGLFQVCFESPKQPRKFY